ncbi:putative porin [bacterium]|nr:putative porin [bacterium]
MKKQLLSSAIGLALCSAIAANAGSYQIQGDLNYDDGEVSGNDINTTSVSVTYYLDAVDDSKGPFAEAAFINKASSISASYIDLELDYANNTSVDSDLSAIGMEYITKDSGYIIGMSYGQGENSSEDVDSYGITIGKYLTDNITARLSYAAAETDDLADTEVNITGLSFRLFHDFDEQDMYLAVDTGFSHHSVEDNSDSESHNMASAGATLYFTKQLSVYAALDLIPNGDAKGGITTTGVEYFVTPNISTSVYYSDYQPSDGDLDSEATWSFGLTGRF